MLEFLNPSLLYLAWFRLLGKIISLPFIIAIILSMFCTRGRFGSSSMFLAIPNLPLSFVNSYYYAFPLMNITQKDSINDASEDNQHQFYQLTVYEMSIFILVLFVANLAGGRANRRNQQRESSNGGNCRTSAGVR
jgi:hypothetical protein